MESCRCVSMQKPSQRGSASTITRRAMTRSVVTTKATKRNRTAIELFNPNEKNFKTVSDTPKESPKILTR